MSTDTSLLCLDPLRSECDMGSAGSLDGSGGTPSKSDAGLFKAGEDDRSGSGRSPSLIKEQSWLARSLPPFSEPDMFPVSRVGPTYAALGELTAAAGNSGVVDHPVLVSRISS